MNLAPDCFDGTGEVGLCLDRHFRSKSPAESRAMTGRTISHYRVLEKLGVGFLTEVSCVVGLHRQYPNRALAGSLGRIA
jgi:hypothetical protein